MHAAISIAAAVRSCSRGVVAVFCSWACYPERSRHSINQSTSIISQPTLANMYGPQVNLSGERHQSVCLPLHLLISVLDVAGPSIEAGGGCFATHHTHPKAPRQCGICGFRRRVQTHTYRQRAGFYGFGGRGWRDILHTVRNCFLVLRAVESVCCGRAVRISSPANGNK